MGSFAPAVQLELAAGSFNSIRPALYREIVLRKGVQGSQRLLLKLFTRHQQPLFERLAARQREPGEKLTPIQRYGARQVMRVGRTRHAV